MDGVAIKQREEYPKGTRSAAFHSARCRSLQMSDGGPSETVLVLKKRFYATREVSLLSAAASLAFPPDL